MKDVDEGQTGSEEQIAFDNDLNDYERVILAAKLARKINISRIAAREQLPPEEISQIDRRKVTTVALEDLESGKVQIVREEPEPIEETVCTN